MPQRSVAYAEASRALVHGVRRLLRSLGAALLVLLASFATVATGATAAPVVILLSFDGMRHDMPARAGLPALQRMAREGARARALLPVFPTDTFPNHVSLATGTYPDRHGIVANRFLDPLRGLFDHGSAAAFLDAEPLWVTAERQGVRAAVFFWVGSETDWHGIGASFRRVPFDSNVTEREKVAQILAWWDLPPGKRPGLVMSWWHGVDHVAHEHGPESSQTRAQLKRQDAALGQLLAGLDARHAWSETTLLVVSDHGMTTLGHSVDLHEVLGDAGIAARVFHSGGTARIHLDRPERADEVVGLLDRLAGVRAYRADAVPEELRYRHPTRTGDVVVLIDPPRYFARAGGKADRWQQTSALWGNHVGGHGYEPRLPEMQGSFLALGRGVAPGTVLGTVRAVDVAPTVARLLGIAPPAQCEGRPIRGLGPAPSAASPE